MIERLNPGSAARLAALHALCFDHAWSQAEFASLLQLPSSLALGMNRDGSFQGFVLARLAADEAEILTIGVLPAQRRSGSGRALLDALHTAVKERDVRRIFLEVSELNAAAQSLYAHTGYTECGRRARYYRDGSDALVLEKSLSGRGQATC